MNSKPVPDITATNAAYFEGCAAGELRLRHCKACDARFRFLHNWCPECWSLDLDHVAASGRGTVSHVSVVYDAPYEAFEGHAPYALVLVELDEGVRMMSNVIGCAPDDVRIGMKVQVAFEQRGDVSIPVFEPA